MCGGTDTCSPTLWLDYLGAPEQNHNSPFPMKYKYGSENITEGVVPKTADFVPCNTTDPTLRCSCADCNTHDLCPDPPQAPKSHFPKTKVFFSVLGVGIFLSFALFIAALVVGFFLCMHGPLGGRRGTTSPSSTKGYGALDDDSPTSSVGSINAEDVPVADLSINPPPSTVCMPCYISGAHLENWIKTVFYHWGCFVARFWPLVMSVGVGLVIFIMLLTAALHFSNTLPFTITTDPVQLWSAPDSRARQEKDYFDEHFNPFYRNELLIFTAKEAKYTTFKPLGLYGVDSWTFGPVMDPDVLLEVRCSNVL